MACQSAQRSLRHLFRDNGNSTCVPLFLLPALATSSQTRPFSKTAGSRSRIGRATITIPPEVSMQFIDLDTYNPRSRASDQPRSAVQLTGPTGDMTLPLPPFMKTEHNVESRKITLTVLEPKDRNQKAMWGTTRAQFQNHVLGVSEGHSCILKLVGVGYRATIEKTATTKEPEYPDQRFIVLKLGFAHPVEMPIPQGVKVTIPQPTRILLESCDKNVVTQFAANIRMWRKPEPYKGKGIFVNNETIKLKSKKIS